MSRKLLRKEHLFLSSFVLSTMIVIVFVLSLLMHLEAKAQIFETPLFDCQPSVTFKVDNYPGTKNIGRTNNLRRKTGSGYVAEGERIYVRGRVLDKLCVPVSDALVEIWQTDPEGNYESEDEHFSNTGSNRTGNEGKFSFLTIVPGSENENSAAHINFRVSHAELGELNTRMYFSRNRGNLIDYKLAELDSPAKPVGYRTEEYGGEKVYMFNITYDKKKKFLWY